MNALKDAARLLAYLVLTLFIGALGAPLLYWLSRYIAAHGAFTFLLRFDFETFFHRAVLIAALLLLWPLIRSLNIARQGDLGLTSNRWWRRDLSGGFLFAAVPLALVACALVALRIYQIKATPDWHGLPAVVASSAAVPVIEEWLFRGLVLGVLLRSWRPSAASGASAAFFSIVHFLKAPANTSTDPRWFSGFVSIAHAFDQFAEPMLVLGGFTTLFAIGWILADARLRTRSLWLPIGLHAGWIVASGAFGKFAQRQIIALPWLGKNLLVGIVPLVVAAFTWWLVRLFTRYAR